MSCMILSCAKKLLRFFFIDVNMNFLQPFFQHMWEEQQVSTEWIRMRNQPCIPKFTKWNGGTLQNDETGVLKCLEKKNLNLYNMQIMSYHAYPIKSLMPMLPSGICFPQNGSPLHRYGKRSHLNSAQKNLKQYSMIFSENEPTTHLCSQMEQRR